MHSNKQQVIRQSSFKLQAADRTLAATKQQASSFKHAPYRLPLYFLLARLPLVACRFTFCLLACSLAAVSAAEPPEKVYVVNDYRYIPANDTDDRDTGLSLCGTRCNALTTDYLNITEVGGWQLMKGEANKELTVGLNSPFIKGQCICIADEYLVKIDDRYSEERRRQGKRK